MRSYSILIVEDEAIVALDISNILKEADFITNRICSSYDQIFKDFDSYPYPDLVLMDININGSPDGTEAALILKRDYNIPVIFITAYMDEEIIRKAKRSSPYGYIVKPFEKRKLLLDIEIALNTINLEKRIKYREELFSATINSITDAVIVTDQNNLIKFMNYIARSMLVNPDVLNKNFMTVYKIDFDNEKNRGKFKDRNGKSRILGIQKSKLKSKLSGKGCYVWVLRDITIPVFLESQLRESQKMEAIGRLAGGVAHDFNNLLTVILGYCSLILDNNESSSINDDLLNDITGIQLTSQKAVRLTKQLLTFTANQVHNPRYVDLNSIIYALNQIKEKLLPDEIQFNISLTSGKTIINVDPVQIEQVLINLIINSRDAISGLGEIDINTSIIDTESYNNSFINLLTGEYIKLTVKDNGSGIPEGIKSKIFEPFFSTKIEGKGLGLGLSTVYGIVQHSGGFIDVESSLETGTSFNLYFPKIKKDASELYEKSQLINLDMGKEIVLLVEKDEFVRSIMSRILDNKGYFVVETNNPGEALLLCENKEKPIKLIITDLFMPLISGVELVRRVRTFFPEISILYTSTHNQESIISEKYLNESNYFIQKPFDPDDFSLLVRKSLDSN